MWVIYAGNSFDGGEIFGPFDSEDAALEFAETELLEWHLIKLIPPEEIKRINE